MLKPEQFNYFSTYLLGAEAESRGIKVTKIFTKGGLAKHSHLVLTYKKHEEVIIGQRTRQTDCIGYWISKNKQVAKYFFSRAGLQVAKGGIYDANDMDEITKQAKRIKYPVVLKPVAGIQGTKVFLGVDSDKKLKKIIKENFKGKVLLEKEYFGKEYRLLAIRDKFLAAIYRVPANVQGDGIHGIKDLIELKNKDPRRGSGHKKSLVKIKIDGIVKDYLKKQGKKLSSVPNKDEIVYLRPNSNISTGGDSIDVTDLVNPEVKKLAVKVIKSIPGLAYGGIDYLTKDITAKPTTRNYIVIEVNDSPMISMHHFPYQGKERNVAASIIDQIFPETKNK